MYLQSVVSFDVEQCDVLRYPQTHDPPFQMFRLQNVMKRGWNDAKPFWSACQWQCPPTHPPSLLLSWRPFSPLDATIY